MPIFEYKCSKCEHKMKVLEKHYGKRKHICEKCGSSELRRMFSDFAVGHNCQSGSSCLTGTCQSS
ncbi:MAG: hypothetical protein ISS70_18460 [Phycisphaerae bacterium]|nr:hypothetical protein [Phycisphaerae bacterium]